MTERIKSLISQLGLSTRSFALKCGLRQNTLSNQLNGVRELSLSTVIAILTTYPEISAEWFMRGIGEMFNSGAREDDADAALYTRLSAAISALNDVITIKDAQIANLNERIKQLETQL